VIQLLDKQKSCEETRRKAYSVFPQLLRSRAPDVGVEIGVRSGGQAESLLSNTTISRLYGVALCGHNHEWRNRTNLDEDERDQIHQLVMKQMEPFADRYVHIQNYSREAAEDIRDWIDFVLLNGDHSYKETWNNLRTWFTKIRLGGIMGGHYYDHHDFPGVKNAVDRFFRRLDWVVNTEDYNVWWTEKKPINVSFFIPAYNCAATIEESVDSIMAGNFQEGDELVICNDCSTDSTQEVLSRLKEKYPVILIKHHTFNKGGAAARNTAVENSKNPLLFCLDSDNILVPESVPRLKEFLLTSGADIAAFGEMHYFVDSADDIPLKWIFRPETTLADYLSGPVGPGASGNYMFTRESWHRAGGYPEFSGALDAWGFGFRQLATGSKMRALADSFYFHRYGHESYWIREKKKGKISLTALQILIPFIELIEEKDVKYIFGNKGRNNWFSNLKDRPLRIKGEKKGSFGVKIYSNRPKLTFSQHLRKKLKNILMHL